MVEEWLGGEECQGVVVVVVESEVEGGMKWYQESSVVVGKGVCEESGGWLWLKKWKDEWIRDVESVEVESEINICHVMVDFIEFRITQYVIRYWFTKHRVILRPQRAAHIRSVSSTSSPIQF
ncbi:hypothetical protein Pcinc_043210 [Petrolisthes cinctipes]|uniref:Uncharacterized protein n=1 Tax=Petrolisthes cinctipes TaxID=88211 RepID=A0AAE1BI15_PETCI|nr:hypothetical protein Pcinc_043210 [Petrolisthes cinctipes]